MTGAPIVPPEPPDLSAPRLDVLRRAIALYLATAYDGAPLPAAVARRLDWPEGIDAPAPPSSEPPPAASTARRSTHCAWATPATPT